MPTEEEKGQQNPPGAGAGGGANPPGAGAPDNVGGEVDSDLSAEDIAKLPEWARLKLNKHGRENAQLRKQLREKEAAEAEQAATAKRAEDERLAKQGEYQKLAEQRAAEIETLKSRAALADAYETRIKADNQARIAKVPEKLRDMIPEYTDPVKLNEWLVRNGDKLVAPEAPKLNGGQSGDKQRKPITGGKYRARL